MAKYTLKDEGSITDCISGTFFLVFGLLVLFVILTSIHPFPDSLISAVAYYLMIVAVLIGIWSLIRFWVVIRWAEVDSSGIVIHDGFLYGLIWTTRIIPQSKIRVIKRQNDIRKRIFKKGAVHYIIEVCLMDGSSIYLSESIDDEESNQQIARVRKALEKDKCQGSSNM